MITIENTCFHTLNQISLPDTARSLLEPCNNICQHYSNLWNPKSTESDVWGLNHSYGTTVSVSLETAKLLILCERFKENTDGAFNILTYTQKSLIETQPNISPEKLHRMSSDMLFLPINISGTDVCIPSGTQLDFGGIAKGYVCDRLAEFLQAQGVTSGLINLGGNIYVIGYQNDGHPWKIGIRNPFSQENDCICFLEVHDQSVVTSGMYERTLSFHGKSVHHIIDPRTGAPVQSDLASVTIVGNSSTECDALATAVTVMGVHDGLEFLRRHTVDALLISTSKQIVYTANIHPVFLE